MLCYNPHMDDEDIIDLPPSPADFRIAYGPDPSNFGDLRLPPQTGPHPVVVVIHGGFWRARYDLEHIGYLCGALTHHGMATWNIEYRRLGNVGGGWPGTFIDVAAATSYLRALAPIYHLDLGRVIAMGHSAGGHLALWLGGLARVSPDSPIYSPNPLPLKASISLAGVSDLRMASEWDLSAGVTQEFIGAPGQHPERYAAASPAELLPLGIPQFLLHGTEDQNVPFEMSRHYAETARAKGDAAELISFPGLGHFEFIDPASDAWPRLLETVLRNL